MSKNLKITLKAAEFNTIDSGTQKDVYLAINNKWAKKLCKQSFDGLCKKKNACMECMAQNGFSYALYDTLTVSKSGKSTDYPIKMIGRGYGKPEFGAEQGTKYFIVSI